MAACPPTAPAKATSAAPDANELWMVCFLSQ
jgi:hypothetical protein